MTNSQSWVETTVPPGYAMYAPGTAPGAAPWCRYGWCVGATHNEADEWTSESFSTREEACRAAWRRWTAAVLRGRGDVRAVGGVDYAKSGGIAWVVYRSDGTLGCWTQGAHAGHYLTGGYYSCADDLAHHLVVCKRTEDLDQAMARFAMLVLVARGPVTP